MDFQNLLVDSRRIEWQNTYAESVSLPESLVILLVGETLILNLAGDLSGLFSFSSLYSDLTIFGGDLDLGVGGFTGSKPPLWALISSIEGQGLNSSEKEATSYCLKELKTDYVIEEIGMDLEY